MADNYSQGTVAPFLPLDELALAVLDADPDDIPNEDDVAEGYERTEAQEVLLRLINESMAEPYELQLTAVKDTTGLYYLYSEMGAGDLELAFLQWLLERLDPADYPYITYEYAMTCSKMRPGEFGGGAWFLTRNGAEFTGSGMWLREKIKEMNKLQ